MDDDPNKSDASDQRRQTLADVFTSVAGLAVYIVAGLIALEEIGVNTGPLLGSVAILGLAVSFGSQNLVRDVVNGFFILLENQFAVGDVITISGKTGTVERVTIRSTWVRSYNGDVHVVPNGTIALVSNQTREWSRAVCDVGVGYDSDLVQVRDVVNQVGLEMKEDPAWSDVLDEAPTWVGVTELGDSSVVVRVVAKVSAGGQWGAVRELNERLKVAFDAKGIEIPFPQQVVHRPEDSSSAPGDLLKG
jgi:small conductance mechanosensitive channel